MKHLLAPAAAGLLLLVPRAYGHHAFAAEFDGDKPARLVGTLVKIEWTNPHTYFYLDVKNSHGEIARWACEASNPGALARHGFRRGDVKPGDSLTVDGYLARDGARLLDARRIIFPDGRRVFTGSAGDGAPPSKQDAQ